MASFLHCNVTEKVKEKNKRLQPAMLRLTNIKPHSKSHISPTDNRSDRKITEHQKRSHVMEDSKVIDRIVRDMQ